MPAGPSIVIDASPAPVAELLELEIPAVERVSYRFRQLSGPALHEAVLDFVRARER